jgi:hypothetical protein
VYVYVEVWITLYGYASTRKFVHVHADYILHGCAFFVWYTQWHTHDRYILPDVLSSFKKPWHRIRVKSPLTASAGLNFYDKGQKMVDLMYGGKKNGQKQISASGRNIWTLIPRVVCTRNKCGLYKCMLMLVRMYAYKYLIACMCVCAYMHTVVYYIYTYIYIYIYIWYIYIYIWYIYIYIWYIYIYSVTVF